MLIMSLMKRWRSRGIFLWCQLFCFVVEALMSLGMVLRFYSLAQHPVHSLVPGWEYVMTSCLKLRLPCLPDGLTITHLKSWTKNFPSSFKLLVRYLGRTLRQLTNIKMTGEKGPGSWYQCSTGDIAGTGWQRLDNSFPFNPGRASSCWCWRQWMRPGSVPFIRPPGRASTCLYYRGV